MTSWIGTLVSGSFLYVIAALNVVILLGIVKVFREMRTGTTTRKRSSVLNNRGLMNRFLGRVTQKDREPAPDVPGRRALRPRL